MDANYQDKIGSKRIATEDKLWLPPLSPKEAKRERRKRARLRLWRMQIKRHRLAIGSAAIVLVAVIALIIAGYWFNGTGFDGHTKVSTATEITSNPQKVTKTEEYQPGKTLWDWLQLLIIPAVLAIGGFWLNQIQKSREQRITEKQAKNEQKAAERRAQTERAAAEKRAQTDRDIAADNQRETLLLAYIDKMSELLLDANRPLRESKPEDEVRRIARARTLTVLSRLDSGRRKRVLQFLFESRLIDKKNHPTPINSNNPIVELSSAEIGQANFRWIHLEKADLRGALGKKADFRGGYLFGVDLKGAHFEEADFSEKADLRLADFKWADLRKANLSEAKLNGADLSGANLSGANLSGANLSRPELREDEIKENRLKEDINLRGAMLQGADLSGTDLSKTNLSKAQYNKKPMIYEQDLKLTQWPEGFNPDAAGAVCVDC